MTERPLARGDKAEWQEAQLVEIGALTATVKRLVLELPHDMAFRPGQHVDLRLSAPDGYQAVRSYSIASAPGTSGRTRRIELAIELLDNGEVSPFFHAVAEVGDSIELRGPLGGHFVWRPEDGGPLLLIGGGAGVAPLMAMLRQRQLAPAQVPAVLLLASRTLETVLYRDELLEMDRAGAGFALRLALSGGPRRRDVDYERRVDAAMLGDVISLLPGLPRYVLICGSNGFVNAAADRVVAAGVAAAVVRTERYGG